MTQPRPLVPRSVPLGFGLLTLGSVIALLAWDVAPALFPAHAHNLLGTGPLALIAVAYLTCQAWRRPAPLEVLKACVLSLAFQFWAANQAWPD